MKESKINSMKNRSKGLLNLIWIGFLLLFLVQSSFASGPKPPWTERKVFEIERTGGKKPIKRHIKYRRYQTWGCTNLIVEPELGIKKCLDSGWVTHTQSIRFYKTKKDIKNSKLFTGYTYTFKNGKKDDKYIGCGPKAAQNVLRYFGIKKSQAQIIKNGLKIHKFNVRGKGKIATTPAELRHGLQKNLDKYNYKNRIEVVLVQNRSIVKSLIPHYLEHGYPVIALVNNGSHWVSITACIDHSKKYYVMGNKSTTWWKNKKLNLSFNGATSIFSKLGIVSSFKPNTIIYFKKVWGQGRHAESNFDNELESNNIIKDDAFAIKNVHHNNKNGITNIVFSLPKASNVKCDIYSLRGKLLYSSSKMYTSYGKHTISVNKDYMKSLSITSGMYLIRLSNKNSHLVHKWHMAQ